MKGCKKHCGAGSTPAILTMNRKDKRTKDIVAVDADGSMCGYFERIVDAARKYNLTAGKISDACKTGHLYYGLKWMYNDDYHKLWLEGRTHELAYKRTKYTQPMKKGTSTFKPMSEWSEESRQKRKEQYRQTAYRLVHDPNCRFGKVIVRKPVLCVTTGKEYPSIKAAAVDLGIPKNQISGALSRNGTVHGYKFKTI